MELHVVLRRISTLSSQTQEARTHSAIVQSLIPFFPSPSLFFILKSQQRGFFTAHHRNCSHGQGRADMSSGCSSLAGGQENTNPVPRDSMDPVVPHSWTPGSQVVGGVASQAEWPLPTGETLPWCSPKTDHKGNRVTFFERSGYNWRAVVNCGQAFPLLFHSCLMFWKIFRKMTLTALCQAGRGWKKMKFGRHVIHSACSLDDIQWLTQEF